MNPNEARGEIVYRRTYSRPLIEDDTVFETWEETIDRVIQHQKWLWERALTHKILRGMPLGDITEDMLEWIQLNEEQELELEELRNIILERRGIVSGRQLWLGGTDVGKKHESSLFNCSFAEARTIYDIVDLFWLLLNGCGVGIKPIEGTLTGFRTTIKELEIIRSTRAPDDKGIEINEEYVSEGTWVIRIGDSAQSWSKSIGKLLAGKYKVNKLVIDLSEIRGAGYRLKGYGWISSGDAQLAIAFPKIFNILNNRAGSILTKLDIIDIIDLLGSVLSSRRSAIITFVDYGSSQWREFSKFKEKCFEKEYLHRQQSNNSLMFWNKPTKEELSDIFDIMIESGGSEPGFLNAENMKRRAPFASGGNPCMEILLSSHSFCNLVEIPVSKYKNDMPGLYKTIELLSRSNYRQTCVDLKDGILQETWNLNQSFTRLCGVSLTGIAERSDLNEYDLKNMRYCAVAAARSMAKELDTPFPKNVTTLKPSGCRIGSELLTTKEGLFILDELFNENDKTWEPLCLTIPQNNKTNKTIHKFKNGLSNTIKIKLSLGMEIQCTPEHKWWIHRRNRPGSSLPSKKFKPQWVKTKDLQIGKDFIEIHNKAFDSINPVKLNLIQQTNINNSQTQIKQPKFLNKNISWLLGYLWGDGSLSPEKYKIRFIDEHIYNLEKVKKILYAEFNIISKIHKASGDRNASVLEIGCKNLYNWIIENNFYKYDINNDLNYIPKKVRQSSELIISFLAGLIDSDGCISIQNNLARFMISTSQDRFAKHIQEVCWAVGLGIGRSLNTKGNSFQYKKHMWLLTSNININKDSFNILQENSNKILKCKNDWHFENYKSITKHKGKVISLDYIENKVETYDIEVENEPWYYAGAIKSHNTVSKLMSTTEGIHVPLGKYIFNWINFSKHDPLVSKLKQANYRTLDNPNDTTSKLICFPIKWDNIEFTKVTVERNNGIKEILEVNKESAIEQLERYKFYMRNWCDQNVSNTISYDIEEKDLIIEWLLTNWNDYIGVSFLFRTDPTMSAQDLGFNYLPQEVVTKEKYETYINEIIEINFDGTESLEELESMECSSGTCPIR